MKNRVAAISFLFLSLHAYAFPENVRHGYLNCTTCHVSPSGGGVLNPYGKSLSAELMSTWGTAKTAGFFFNDNENENQFPPWFRGNVFLSGVQTRRNTPTFEKAQFFPMQADFETGYDGEKLAIIGTVGLRSKDLGRSKDLDQIFSRRHYILYRLTDQWALRAGKFMASFGLNGPDHVSATRRGLGWDQGTESYNLEASFSGENASTLITIRSDSPIERSATKDQGFAINQAFLLGSDSKLGFSSFIGGQDLYDRVVIGPYGILSLSRDIYFQSEIFWQQKKTKSNAETQSGYATFNRLGYEALKGFTVFGQFDRSFLNTSDEVTKYDSYGPGVQWFPYPHFELLAYLGKEKAFAQEATDYWWLMANIYF